MVLPPRPQMRPMANTTGNKFDKEFSERDEPAPVADFSKVIQNAVSENSSNDQLKTFFSNQKFGAPS